MSYTVGYFVGSLAAGSINRKLAKALVLLLIVVLIRFRPQGLFVARVRT